MSFTLSLTTLRRFWAWLDRHGVLVVGVVLSIVSVIAFVYYLDNGLGLAYNDARSHLDIGRRVVEGLKPGLAQLGSVWLPLTHIFMTFTIWNDFMWHSGLAGALLSMIGFVGTGILIYLILRELGVDLGGRLVGVLIFATNINILYLQSTAMTELVLIATMTAATYYFLMWYKHENVLHLISSAFWIMLATLVRYDGWFLFAMATGLILFSVWKKRGYVQAEGTVVMFCTLGGLGIILWLLWNLLIFKDPLYFAFGPYSAYAQQKDLESAGDLLTKHEWLLSFKYYFYAMAYNSNALFVLLGIWGAAVLWLERTIPAKIRYASLIFLAPLLFNIVALYLGHSVLFIQGLSGESWFNVRYGVMMLPSIAIFIGYLSYHIIKLRPALVGLIIFTLFFSFSSGDAVTIDDARFGSSQKNVTEVSSWLQQHAKDTPGFILISAASHDAIIFSSNLPMKKFIHEGTGNYWKEATTLPDKWARWIIMRTYSNSDSTWRLVSKTPGFERYRLITSFPFADIYALKDEYIADLTTEPTLGKQK